MFDNYRRIKKRNQGNKKQKVEIKWNKRNNWERNKRKKKLGQKIKSKKIKEIRKRQIKEKEKEKKIILEFFFNCVNSVELTI